VAADQQQPKAPAEPAVRPDFTAEELREHVPPDLRSVSFPVAVRGYDRGAVDAYVKRVNRVIAELEVGRTPQAAVRHALDRVGQQTIAVLQEARESADKLMLAAREEGDEARARAKAEAANLVVNASADADRTKAEAEQLLASARAEAEQSLASARAEAAEIVERARADAAQKLKETEDEIRARREEGEARLREIDQDTQTVLVQRHDLLQDVRTMAAQLQQLATAAVGRVAVEEPAESDPRDSEMATISEANPQPAQRPSGRDDKTA
jgi:DivIVA domain-containing protein